MRKSLVALMAIIVVLSITLTACKSESGQNIVSKALGIDVSSGNEVSSYDTHSGNGDGTSCIALSFNDDTVLEKIKNNTEWSAFPLDETVQTLVYTPDQWKVFEDTHEAIIDKEMFEIVQKIRAGKRRPTRMGEMPMFSGLLYCADCGSKLTFHRKADEPAEKHHYICGNYRSNTSNCIKIAF